MTLTRTLLVVVVVLFLLVIGLTHSISNPALAQSNLQLADVRLTDYLSNGNVWVPVPAGSPVPATALKFRFQATVVNGRAGDAIRLKANLHEMCFLTRTKKFEGRMQWIGSNEPSMPIILGANLRVTIDTNTECFLCRSRCGKSCPDKDHLGEGPHMASLTIAGNDQFTGTADPPKGLRSFTSFTNFETFCPPEQLRKRGQSKKKPVRRSRQ